jgi:hypothetical protein
MLYIHNVHYSRPPRHPSRGLHQNRAPAPALVIDRLGAKVRCFADDDQQSGTRRGEPDRRSLGTVVGSSWAHSLDVARPHRGDPHRAALEGQGPIAMDRSSDRLRSPPNRAGTWFRSSPGRRPCRVAGGCHGEFSRRRLCLCPSARLGLGWLPHVHRGRGHS